MMMVGRDVLVTLSKDFGSTILRQNIAHALAQHRVIVWRVEGLMEDIRKDCEHLFFELAIVALQLFEVLLGRGGGAAHAFEEHLDQLVWRLNLGVIEKTDEQAIPSRSVVNMAHVADFEGRGLRRKLLNLCVRDLCQEGPGR